MYSQFLYNLNTGLLLIVIPLIVGLIIYLVCIMKNFNETTFKKVRKVFYLAVG